MGRYGAPRVPVMKRPQSNLGDTGRCREMQGDIVLGMKRPPGVRAGARVRAERAGARLRVGATAR